MVTNESVAEDSSTWSAPERALLPTDTLTVQQLVQQLARIVGPPTVATDGRHDKVEEANLMLDSNVPALVVGEEEREGSNNRVGITQDVTMLLNSLEALTERVPTLEEKVADLQAQVELLKKSNTRLEARLPGSLSLLTSSGGQPVIPSTDDQDVSCPVSMCLRLRLLDPPENQRTYSSVYGDDEETRFSHGRSKLNSPQAWSAKSNDTHQWMIIDAGTLIVSLAGVVVAIRKDLPCQCVTRVRVCVKESETNSFWTEVVDSVPTNLSASNEMVWIPFKSPAQAQFVKIQPLEWTDHISMRCALLVGNQNAE